MTVQISPFSIAFLTVAAVSGSTAILVWRKRQASGGIPLFLMMLAATEWNLADFMETSHFLLADKILWTKIAYVGAYMTPGLFLLFALDYTGRTHWSKKRNLILLFSIPVITILLAATNEWHHLIWTGFSQINPNTYIYHHGIWFWVATIYINAMLIWGSLTILHFALSSKAIYSYQTVGLMIAISLPWISFFIYLSNQSPFPGLDLTAIAFAFTGFIIAFIILYLQFLDILPVARETLFENMADGLLVLDARERIVDINPAAKRLFNIKDGNLIGRKIDQVLADFPDLTDHVIKADNPESVITIHTSITQHIDFRTSHLYNRSGKVTGRLIVLRDITRLVQADEALEKANLGLMEKLSQVEKLESQLRELSNRDPLTGIFNRRFIEGAVEKELEQAKRARYSIGFLMIDIDNFKEFNDLHGHNVGDQVLIALANYLSSSVRRDDFVCRYGGDEFLVVMKDLPFTEIQIRAEGLCRGFDSLKIKVEGVELHTTISIGISVYPQQAGTLQDIFEACDTAMYTAKRAGRNRVSMLEVNYR